MQISPIRVNSYNGSVNAHNSANTSFGLNIKKNFAFEQLYKFLTEHHPKEDVDEAIRYIEKIGDANADTCDYEIKFYAMQMKTKFVKVWKGFWSPKEVKSYYYSPASFYSFNKNEAPCSPDYMLSLTRPKQSYFPEGDYEYIPLQQLLKRIKDNFQTYIWRQKNK